MSRGSSQDQQPIDPRRRGNSSAHILLPVPALYSQGESEWDQGLCGEYAAALQQLHAHLQIGIIGEERADGWDVMHVVAHDQHWAYDVTGATPLTEVSKSAREVGVQLQTGYANPATVPTSGTPIVQWADEVDRARRLIEAAGQDQQLTGPDLRNALESLSEQFSLTERETDILGYYAGDSIHEIVNTWLRGGELHKTGRELGRAYVNDLDTIFSRAPGLDSVARVYRGINAPELIAALEHQGGVHEPGFLSTAIDPERARSFANHPDTEPDELVSGSEQQAGKSNRDRADNGRAVLEITIPAGTPLLPIHEIVENLPYGSEEEVLLDRGGYLTLEGIDHQANPPLYRVRYDADGWRAMGFDAKEAAAWSNS